MAITYSNVADTLREMYKNARDKARFYGGEMEAERIREEYETQLKRLQMQENMSTANAIGSIAGAYQSALAQQQAQMMYNALTTGTGIGLMSQTAQNIAKQDVKYELGVLYLDGGKLPDDWRGAQIDKVSRSIAASAGSTPRWLFNFTSKWSADSILLHLDAEELSGKEAMRVAETYKEALNQRRVG